MFLRKAKLDKKETLIYLEKFASYTSKKTSTAAELALAFGQRIWKLFGSNFWAIWTLFLDDLDPDCGPNTLDCSFIVLFGLAPLKKRPIEVKFCTAKALALIFTFEQGQRRRFGPFWGTIWAKLRDEKDYKVVQIDLIVLQQQTDRFRPNLYFGNSKSGTHLTLDTKPQMMGCIFAMSTMCFFVNL